MGLLVSMATLAVAGFTWVQIKQVGNEQTITRQGQFTDRFNSAAGNLGNKSQDVRLGGIYALQRLMQDSPRDQPVVLGVLSSYIRTHATKPKHRTVTTGRAIATGTATDIIAALAVIMDRDPGHDLVARRGGGKEPATLYLSNAELDYADLINGSLEHAHFEGAVLAHAVMQHVDLRHATLNYVRMESAIADGAQLRHALLESADLKYADLTGADLRDVDLRGADLKGAHLHGADLRGADLSNNGWGGQPGAVITAEQVLTTTFDKTTGLPTALANDPRIRKALASGNPH